MCKSATLTSANSEVKGPGWKFALDPKKKVAHEHEERKSWGEAGKEWEQYDIRRGISPLTFETLIVLLMTRSRGGGSPGALNVVAHLDVVAHLGVKLCWWPKLILVNRHFNP